jgi:hypothetical protein
MDERIGSDSPANPPPKMLPFVAVGKAVMRGDKCEAVACSSTMAQRIARALNLHQPNRRGV